MTWKKSATSVTVTDPVSVEGTVDTKDSKTEALLKCLIEQQKITNLYLSDVVGETYNIRDLME